MESCLVRRDLMHLQNPSFETFSWSFADGIDQDQTAQNVQSDLYLCRPVVRSDICGTIICGTLWILFTVFERCWLEISGAETVKFSACKSTVVQQDLVGC